MKDLSQATMLWLPSYMVEDDEAVDNITKANGLILDFCDRDIGFEELLDELATVDVDVDNYLETLDTVLRDIGI